MANENKFEEIVSASEEVHGRSNLNDFQKSQLKSDSWPKPGVSLHHSENKENNNLKSKFSTCSNFEEQSPLCPKKLLATSNSTSSSQDKDEISEKSAVIQQLGSLGKFSHSITKQEYQSVDDSSSDLKAELHFKPKTNDWSVASSKSAALIFSSSDSDEEIEIVSTKKQKSIQKQNYYTSDNSNSDSEFEKRLHLASKSNMRTLESSKPDVLNICSNSDDEDEIVILESRSKKQTLIDVINLCSDSDDENEILPDNSKSFNTKSPFKYVSQLPTTLPTSSAIESNGTNSEIVFDKSTSYNMSSNSNPSLDLEHKVFDKKRVKRKVSSVSSSSKTLKNISVLNSGESGLDIPSSSKNPLYQSESSVDTGTNKYLHSAIGEKKRACESIPFPSTPPQKKLKIDFSFSNIGLSELNANEKSVPRALPSTQKREAKSPKSCPANNQSDYDVLAALDDVDLVLNTEPFECLICFSNISSGDGVLLHDCLHSFCKLCLADVIQHSETVLVRCPYHDEYACESNLQEREVKSLVSPEVFEKYLQKSITLAESQAEDSFHCKTINCIGWCMHEKNVSFFLCPVCSKNNCLACAAIHEGKNCQQYQDYVALHCDTDEEAKRTKKYLDVMLKKKQAKPCPNCKVIIIKHGGCDHMTCRMCKTHFSWNSGKPAYEPITANVWPAMIANRRLAVYPDAAPLGGFSAAMGSASRRLSASARRLTANNQPTIENIRQTLSMLDSRLTHVPATATNNTGLSSLLNIIRPRLQAQSVAEPIASTSRGSPSWSRGNAQSTESEIPLGMPTRRSPLNHDYEQSTELQQALRHYPGSVVMNIKCPVCYKNSFIFSHAQEVVYCDLCSAALCEPTGGMVILSRDVTRIS